MRLNADIIYQNLEKYLDGLAYEGVLDDELTLFRPEFYIEKNTIFQKDHVYVCSADHLPKTPVIEEHVLLISLGRLVPSDIYVKTSSIIFVPEEEDIFHVFNLTQEVFNRYEAWEARMNEILRTTASLQELVDLSRDILENPILLIGSDFRYLAYTDRDYLESNLGIRFEGPTFDQNLLAKFLTMHEIATDIREPILLNLQDRSTLSFNIFDGDQFLGCLTVFAEMRGIRSSDVRLCMFLSGIIRQAFGLTPSLAGDHSIMRNALQMILSGQPIGNDDRRIISKYNNRQPYICVSLKLKEQQGRLPSGYAASLIEQNYNGAAFEQNGDVAAVIQLDEKNKETSEDIAVRLEEFLERMKMEGGISQVFIDLYDAKYAFKQAQAALEMGKKFGKDQPLYRFDDHILQKLLTMAVGEMPVRYLYTEGLMRLWEHDQVSAVSYIDTLRKYLDCSLSIAQTARELHLHRSSLIDRLDRILQILDMDLDDSDNRLLLQLVLRAGELLNE